MDAVRHSRSRDSMAHRRSTEISDTDLVKALTSKLGTRLVAFIAGRDVSTISRWKSAPELPETASRALRTVYQVFELLEEHESDHTIRAWFIGMNPQLDDVSPAGAINAGKYREVIVAARAFLTSG